MKCIGQFVLCRLRNWLSCIPARCRELRGESGQALVEMMFMIGVIGVPLLLVTTDLATIVYASIEVSNAAHAGTMCGMASATAASQTSTITTAAQNEAADFSTSNLTITPTTYYACSSAEGGTQYTGTGNQVNSTALNNVSAVCPSGAANHYLEFVQVVVSATVTPPFHCPGTPSTYTLNSTSVMEVEQ
jgi:Flp pilus assembly protein TadG